MSPWLYLQSEPHLWTVGFYDPAGRWHAESDHASPDEAAARVHYLNGRRIDADDAQARRSPEDTGPTPAC